MPVLSSSELEKRRKQVTAKKTNMDLRAIEQQFPAYAPAKMIKVRIGLSRKHLLMFVRQGFVRSVKLTESRRGSRLYLVADVLEVLERMSVGKQPLKKTKETKDDGLNKA
jgi:hypothetical protein